MSIIGDLKFSQAKALYETLKELYTSDGVEVLKPYLMTGDGTAVGSLLQSGGIIESIFNTLIPVAGMMLTIYIFVSLTDKVTQELASMQVMYKFLIELIVASMILCYGYPLVRGIAGIGDVVIDQISIENSSDVDTSEYFKNILKKYHLSEDIESFDSNSAYSTANDDYKDTNSLYYFGENLRWMIWPVVKKMMNIVVYAVAIQRLIQICVYVALSPIAIINVFGGGIRQSKGLNFFKKLAAVSLQGAALYLLMFLTAFIASPMGGLAETLGPFSVIASQLAMVMAVLKSEQYANDLVI